MAEHARLRLWLYRLAYLGLSLALILFHLLPLEYSGVQWAGPDLLLAIPLAWAVRRREYVPPLSVAFVLLLADLMFQRPPGLLAALGVLAVENIKTRATALRSQSFLAEWLNVSALIAAILLGYRILLGLFLVPQAPLALSIMQACMTMLFYPLIVFLSHMLGIRRSAPGDIDALGQRI